MNKLKNKCNDCISEKCQLKILIDNIDNSKPKKMIDNIKNSKAKEMITRHCGYYKPKIIDKEHRLLFMYLYTFISLFSLLIFIMIIL